MFHSIKFVMYVVFINIIIINWHCKWNNYDGNTSSLESISIKITIKKEYLTPPRCENNDHNMRSSDQVRSYSLAVPSSTLAESNDNCSNLALSSLTLNNFQPAKKTRHSDPFVGCCTCSLSSKCLTTKCSYRRTRANCTQFHSKCC